MFTFSVLRVQVLGVTAIVVIVPPKGRMLIVARRAKDIR